MTAQVPDILLHRGARFDLCGQPLYDYLKKVPKRRRPIFASTSTACHRGYVATWETRDGYLHLVALEGVIATEDGFAEADLKTALPWVKDTLRATWFSEWVRCPEGRLVSYVHHAYESVYERDRVFRFFRGQLMGEWVVLNPPAPIIYNIAPDGQRSCVNSMSPIDSHVIPDPLDGEDFSQVYKVWNRPPKRGDDDEDGHYVLGGAYIHPPR